MLRFTKVFWLKVKVLYPKLCVGLYILVFVYSFSQLDMFIPCKFFNVFIFLCNSMFSICMS